jgi:CDP-diacylglycerol--glycerol-3-phosphate 3-phosphatidyltransferase
MNLPNKITVSRIILIFVMIIAMFVLAFIPNFHVNSLGKTGINPIYLVFTVVFIIGAFTDMLDGKIARKCNLVTDLGKFLYPIADKLLNDAMMIFILVPQAYALEQRRDSLMLTILLISFLFYIQSFQ